MAAIAENKFRVESWEKVGSWSALPIILLDIVIKNLSVQELCCFRSKVCLEFQKNLYLVSYENFMVL
jgi:hypothetical protein